MSILVFIHGTGENHKVWTCQTHRFSDSLAIDLFGHSDGEGENAIEAYAIFADDFLAQRRLSGVVWAGDMMMADNLTISTRRSKCSLAS